MVGLLQCVRSHNVIHKGVAIHKENREFGFHFFQIVKTWNFALTQGKVWRYKENILTVIIILIIIINGFILCFVTSIARLIKQNQVVLLCREMDFPAHISVYALAFG